MKKLIYLILATFLFLGCGTFKEIKESNRSEKTRKETSESKKDSVSSVWETLPSSNVIVLDANDFKLRGDFEQSVSSGKGNKTTISKSGGKITIKSDNSGSKNTETSTNSSENKEIYTSEFIINELSKTVKRTSLKYKILFFLLIAIWQRKLLSQLLVSVVPSMAGKRIVKLFLGKTID